MSDLYGSARNIANILSLGRLPVGVEFTSKVHPETGGSRAEVARFCEAVMKSANSPELFVIDGRNLACANARTAFGVSSSQAREADVEEILKINSSIFCNDPLIASEIMKVRPKKDTAEINSVLVTSALDLIAPQCVFFVCQPYQAYLLATGYMYARGEPSLKFEMGGNSAFCAWGAINSGINKKVNILLPCMGAMTFSLVDTSEMVFSAPVDFIADIEWGLVQRTEKGAILPNKRPQ